MYQISNIKFLASDILKIGDNDEDEEEADDVLI